MVIRWPEEEIDGTGGAIEYLASNPLIMLHVGWMIELTCCMLLGMDSGADWVAA